MKNIKYPINDAFELNINFKNHHNRLFSIVHRQQIRTKYLKLIIGIKNEAAESAMSELHWEKTPASSHSYLLSRWRTFDKINCQRTDDININIVLNTYKLR